MQFNDALQRGQVSTHEALALFDSLEPVSTEFMHGRWEGADFPTGHPMDGLLPGYRWYGKEFRDDDHVDPLLFTAADGTVYPVNPSLMPIGLAPRVPGPLNRLMGGVFPYLRPFFRTGRSGARLRAVTHRGKTSAAMIYDRLPIQDIFRRVDDRTVLGVMDYKGMTQPYFFVLRRAA